MSASGFLRGHAMHYDGERWRYDDTGEPTEGSPRPCGYCNLPDREDGHDACLGELPGVDNACCGHGRPGDAYVQLAREPNPNKNCIFHGTRGCGCDEEDDPPDATATLAALAARVAEAAYQAKDPTT